jgi:hypothetical protein
MNKNIVLGILEGIERYIEEGGVFVEENDRRVIKHINRYGAVTSLDMLSRKEINELTYNYLVSL